MMIPAGNPILTTEQMRMADLHTIEHDGISANVLMQEAGQAIAAASLKHKLDGGRVVIVVGIGNNAGDGFVAARILRKKRVAVTVIPLFPLDKFKPEAAEQARLADEEGVKIRPAINEQDLPDLQSWLNRSVVVVDAIFGIGLTRPLNDWLITAIDCINHAQRPILAVDIPSGVHSDTGEIMGAAIAATATLPIAAYKWGHWLQMGKICAGRILPPAPIGISKETIQSVIADYPIAAVLSAVIDLEMVKSAFPKRHSLAYKQSFGHLWIFGGSQGFTGAPKLAAMGAQAVGTGLVSIACPENVYPIIAASSLEVMVHPQEHALFKNANAIVAGPGWGKAHKTMLTEILAQDKPVVLDADALNLLSEKKSLQRITQRRNALTVITPHVGEAARLLDQSTADIQADRLSSALSLAETLNTWVVLKGAQTMVVSPLKQVWVNQFGSANLAVAGTGDILAGIIGGLLAAGITPEIGIPAAVGLHGMAGEQNSWHRAGQLEDVIASIVREFQV